MIKIICPEHDVQANLVCLDEKCPDSSPFCAAQTCIAKHSHAGQVKLMRTNLLDKLQQINSGLSQRQAQSKKRLLEFYQTIRQDLHEYMRKDVIFFTEFQKLIYDFSPTPSMLEAINKLLQGKQPEIQRAVLLELISEIKKTYKGKEKKQALVLQQYGLSIDGMLSRLAERLAGAQKAIKIVQQPIQDEQFPFGQMFG